MKKEEILVFALLFVMAVSILLGIWTIINKPVTYQYVEYEEDSTQYENHLSSPEYEDSDDEPIINFQYNPALKQFSPMISP